LRTDRLVASVSWPGVQFPWPPASTPARLAIAASSVINAMGIGQESTSARVDNCRSPFITSRTGAASGDFRRWKMPFPMNLPSNSALICRQRTTRNGFGMLPGGMVTPQTPSTVVRDRSSPGETMVVACRCDWSIGCVGLFMRQSTLWCGRICCRSGQFHHGAVPFTTKVSKHAKVTKIAWVAHRFRPRAFREHLAAISPTRCMSVRDVPEARR
jgi:hypothetical protein